ncbi:ParA family protein [Streptomyces sp. NPDC057966]|uniref:ParA family protein n=1 Tax=Streptomyces sp. NPDC057966 TaxID=3346292 RepID=UPI0036EFEADA
MWIGVGKGKGGAGCTTSALELAYAATRRRRGGRRRRVAVLDLDPQGNATDVLEPETRRTGIKDALMPGQPLRLRDVLVPSVWSHVMVAPADRFLANREADMDPRGIATLRRARLGGELDDLVDDVVIDLPRDIGKLAAVGLLGAEHLFVAARATVWGAQGAEEMRYTAKKIAEKGNPELSIAGYIVTAYDDKGDSRRVLGEIRNQFGDSLVKEPVPRCLEITEALESYHTPGREFGEGAEVVSTVYQGIYDQLLDASEGEK